MGTQCQVWTRSSHAAAVERPSLQRQPSLPRAPCQVRVPRRLKSVRVSAEASWAAIPEPPSPVSPNSALRSWAGVAEPQSPPCQSWSGYMPNCRGAAAVSQVGKINGRLKAQNQDSVLTHMVQPLDGTSLSILGVFDGHGKQGHHASARVKDAMAGALEDSARSALLAASPPPAAWDAAEPAEPPSPRGLGASNLGAASAMSTGTAALEFTPEAAQACLGEVFSHAASTIADAAAEFLQSGSTAVCCMLLQDSVVAAWVGDSRAVIGVAEEGAYTAVDLTKDHKPNDLHEMARIVAAGGKVARSQAGKLGPQGPYRVFLPQGLSPGLAVARAFGDMLLAKVGVIPDPDFTVFPLSSVPASSRPHVLIVASDGLWQFIDSQEAVDVAAAAGSPEEAAELLLEAARKSWEKVYHGIHQDDISVAVAFL